MAENSAATPVKYWYRIEDNLFEIDSKYTPIELIGKGACKVVCLSINKKTNERVAIKKISFEFENRTDSLNILKEMVFMRCMKHKNVIGITDIMMPTERTSFNDVYVVYETMVSNLLHFIQLGTPLTDDQCKFFIIQLLRGLKHLHSADIFCLDLKPENLLTNADVHLKICDFGLAKSNHDSGQWYRAPELLLNCDRRGSPADIWSVGCILAELLRGKPLFQGTGPLNQLECILSVLGHQHEDNFEFIGDASMKRLIKSLNSFSTGVPFSSLFRQADRPNPDHLALDLLSKMLVFNPSKRITAKEALCHPYFSSWYDPSDIPGAKIHVDIDESIKEPSEFRKLILEEIRLYSLLRRSAFFQ